jgi:FdhD protein
MKPDPHPSAPLGSRAPGRATRWSVTPLTDEAISSTPELDLVADEAPLELQVADADGPFRPLAVVMRTRGDDTNADGDVDSDDGDLDLAAGFLFAEHVIDAVSDLASLAHCTVAPSSDAEGNVVQARLRPGRVVDWARLRRHTFSSSSCGVCGKASIDAVLHHHLETRGTLKLSTSADMSLEEAKRFLMAAAAHQPLFVKSGGCHGAAVVDDAGVVVVAREDVGRHNAVDKVIGALLRAGTAPHGHEAHALTLVLSGRVAFELVQKAARFGVGRIVAKGAPSSLAVELARAVGIQLVAFVKTSSANRYV